MTEVIIADKMSLNKIQQMMLDAFRGQFDLIGQGRYIIVSVSPWIFYQHDIKRAEEAA